MNRFEKEYDLWEITEAPKLTNENEKLNELYFRFRASADTYYLAEDKIEKLESKIVVAWVVTLLLGALSGSMIFVLPALIFTTIYCTCSHFSYYFGRVAHLEDRKSWFVFDKMINREPIADE